jgi:hypothetical protein
MKLYPRLASCLTLAFICTGAMAASQFQPVKDREYREYVNPNNPVAGKAVVGAVVLAAAPDVTKQNQLSVFIPKAMSGQLHLEISSADGRFRGEGTYQGNSQGNEWVTLPLTSATDNQRPADASALAVSVSDGSSASIYVTNWGAPPGGTQAQTLRVFVNSRRGEMYWSAGSGAAQRCASLGAAVPVRFDSVCDVPLAQLAKGASLRLVRRDGFDTESQTLTIAY